MPSGSIGARAECSRHDERRQPQHADDEGQLHQR